jgi:hypothetical protein
MTEKTDTIFYNDQQFEQLMRGYDRRKDRGLTGLIDRIAIFREAHKNLEPERFQQFCERVYLRRNIEKDLLHHFGRRLEELDAMLGRQLEAFGVMQLLLASRENFEEVKEAIPYLDDPDARSLFRDLTDSLVTAVKQMKAGDPDQDIYGMTWSMGRPPEEPAVAQIEAIA